MELSHQYGQFMEQLSFRGKTVQGVFQEDWGRLQSDGMQDSHGEEDILGA